VSNEIVWISVAERKNLVTLLEYRESGSAEVMFCGQWKVVL